jgi:hypothetical protein
VRFVERFIFEAVLKCVEADRAAREASDVSGEPPVNIAQRTELTAQAAKLQRKLRTAKDDFNDGEIHEDEYERRREDIKGAMAGIELKLSSIRKEERKVKQTIPVKTMRERMYAEPEFAASTVDEVLDHFVLMPVGRERRCRSCATTRERNGSTCTCSTWRTSTQRCHARSLTVATTFGSATTATVRLQRCSTPTACRPPTEDPGPARPSLESSGASAAGTRSST